jgi:hypothetical protein
LLSPLPLLRLAAKEEEVEDEAAYTKAVDIAGIISKMADIITTTK